MRPTISAEARGDEDEASTTSAPSPTPVPAAPQYAVVVGATGTGKSAFALGLAGELARRGLSAEVVNADAMQLYRGMDIGTAKLSLTERHGVPHHLLDVLEVTDEASVEFFQGQARNAISSIAGRGAVPILVGGSGLYVSGAAFDFRFPGTDAAIRETYETLLREHGIPALFALLTSRDPVAAAAIGPHNARRMVRALEVGELTGRPFVVGLPDDAPTWGRPRFFGMHDDRARLVQRLDSRVDGMWRDGLVAEVEALIPLGLERGVTASRAIGYAQAIAQVRGETTEEGAREATKGLTRRYARRQVSWFKRYPRVTWSHAGGGEEAVRIAADTLVE